MAAISAILMLVLACIAFRWGYIRTSRRLDLNVSDAFRSGSPHRIPVRRPASCGNRPDILGCRGRPRPPDHRRYRRVRSDRPGIPVQGLHRLGCCEGDRGRELVRVHRSGGRLRPGQVLRQDGPPAELPRGHLPGPPDAYDQGPRYPRGDVQVSGPGGQQRGLPQPARQPRLSGQQRRPGPRLHRLRMGARARSHHGLHEGGGLQGLEGHPGPRDGGQPHLDGDPARLRSGVRIPGAQGASRPDLQGRGHRGAVSRRRERFREASAGSGRGRYG
jgi:hypothetical protein